MSAIKAVVLNFARLRTRASGKKTMSWAKIRYWMGTIRTHLVTAPTNACHDICLRRQEKAENDILTCKFSATKMVYAETKPSWEIVIDVRMA